MPARVPVVILLFMGLALPGAAKAEAWTIKPRITVIETATDNVELTSANAKRSDFVTSVIPGIRIDGDGPRLRLKLDYELHNLLYAKESSRNNALHHLASSGSLEAVEKWLYVDAQASISQQTLSPFGAQPATNENVNTNRAETSFYQVSPYVTGHIYSAADYSLRYKWGTTNSSGSVLGNVQSTEWIGNLKSIPKGGYFSWAVDGTNQKNKFDLGRTVESSRARAILSYAVIPQLRLSVIGGRESNNYLQETQEGKTNYGGSVEWTPTERTRISAVQEKRFFGEGHSFSVQHRTPHTVWSYTDRKDVSTLLTELATSGPGTTFDLLFNSLASRIPDPIARSQEVERILVQNGIPADLNAASSFLASRIFLERNRAISLALLGVRNTITLSANVIDRKALGIGAQIPDTFALTPDIRQRGIAADWALRLTSQSSLGVFGSWLHSTGTRESGLVSNQRIVHVRWSTLLGPKTFATIGARQVHFDSTNATDFRERAVMASITIRF